MENEYRYDLNQNGNSTEDNVERETVQEAVQETTQKVTPETVQETAQEVVQETVQEAAQDVVQETVQENTQETAQQTKQETYQSSGRAYEYGKVNFTMYDPPKYEYTGQEQPKKQKKEKSGKARKWVLCISMAVVFGLVASVVFQASNFLLGNIWDIETEPSKTVTTTQTTANANKELTDIAKVAANVMPSVVSITNLSVQEVQNFFFGGTTIQEYESSGSGIIIGQNDSELLIVSNNHVVEGSSTLTVSFADGASVEAQIKGTDADIDLAIIAVPLSSIEDSTLDAIKVATLGDSDALNVGEPAIAIGNALGYGQSVTSGIISAVNRTIEGFDGELIQTDAAINPGNSGGALLNASGEVIGINTVKVSADAVEGMGYAIPISDVNDIINDLMNRETRTKVDAAKQGALGIKGISVDETTSQLYGIPQGVQVSELIEGGAAEKAGIPKKCIITKFDGTRISSMEELQEQLTYYEAGETVEVVVEVFSPEGEYVEKSYEVTLSKQSILQ